MEYVIRIPQRLLGVDCRFSRSRRACLSAATDFAWCPRPRDEATSRGRLPWLVRLGFWRAFWPQTGRLGRWNWCFRCDFGPCRSRLCVVLPKTAMFVFAARSATTRLVASWSCTGLSSHWKSVLYPPLEQRRLVLGYDGSGHRLAHKPRSRSLLPPKQFEESFKPRQRRYCFPALPFGRVLPYPEA